MTKKEKILFSVVSILFLITTGVSIYFIIQFLNMKVAKVTVEENLRRAKNELELKKVEIEEKQKKIEDLKKKLMEAKDKMHSLLNEVSSLKEEKENLVEELKELKEDFSDIDNALEKRNMHIARLKQELMRTRARLFEVEQYMQAKLNEIKRNIQRKGKTETNQSVSLGKVIVNPSQGKDSSNQVISARVLSVNRKYDFAIFALPRSLVVHAGTRVLVRTEGGKEFSSVIDTVRNNLVTMDIPKDLEIAIGDTVQISFTN